MPSSAKELESFVDVIITKEELVAYFDGDDIPEDLATELDKAQGDVQPGSPQYIVIKVKV